MKIFALKNHLLSKPGVAGAMRAAWGGKAYVTLSGMGGSMYWVAGGMLLPYALTFDDLTADDWEPM